MNYTTIKNIKKYITFELTSDSKKYIYRKCKDLSNEVNILLKNLGYILPIPKSATITKEFLNRIITLGVVGYAIYEYDKDNYKYIAEQYLKTFNKNFKKIKDKKIIFYELSKKNN